MHATPMKILNERQKRSHMIYETFQMYKCEEIDRDTWFLLEAFTVCVSFLGTIKCSEICSNQSSV